MKNLVYLLEPFLRREHDRVVNHNQKATDRGLTADLTLAQWLRNCRLFEYKCAYCKKGSMESMEHLIPLSFGGGTTESNVVPCCIKCNDENGRATQRAIVARRKLETLLA